MNTNVLRLAAAATLAASALAAFAAAPAAKGVVVFFQGEVRVNGSAADIESLAARLGETIDWGKVDK
jgi:hypothetical protein